MLAQDLITFSLKELGEFAPGETPSSDDLNDGLVKLNELVASWDIQRLNIFAIQQNLWNLANGTQSYTIGSGAAFNGTRPVSIRKAVFVSSASHRFPLDPLTAEEWASIVERSSSGQIVRKLYYDNNYPLATIYVWPIPSNGGQLELQTWEQISSFATLNTTFDLPPGYELALRLNLAVAMAPMYGRPLDPVLKDNADRALAALRGLNAPPQQGEAQEIQAQGAARPAPGPEILAEPR